MKTTCNAVAACLTALMLASILQASETGTAPRPPQVVILKLDDLRNVDNAPVHKNWQRMANYLATNRLHASFGIIGSSLESESPAYFDWIKLQHSKGAIEFWLHGYHLRTKDDKTGEFEQGSAAGQQAVLERVEKLAKEKLGFTFAAFGPHWTGTTVETEKALQAVPEITIWLNGPATPAFYKKTSLPRCIAMEDTTFVPDFGKFKTAYSQFAATQPFLVLQGHPVAWVKEEQWTGFFNIVEFLKSKGCIFMTPSEYVHSTQPARPATQSTPARSTTGGN